MKWVPLEKDDLFRALEPLVSGASGGELALLEVKTARHKGTAQVSITVFRPGKSGRQAVVGVEDCQKVSRAVQARVELAFDGADVTLEVSSPGIERKIVNGAEFAYFIGRGIRVYRTDITEWSAGALVAASEKNIKLETKEGILEVNMEVIAKARLDWGVEP
jgi:ribosome maturation factor RimP